MKATTNRKVQSRKRKRKEKRKVYNIMQYTNRDVLQVTTIANKKKCEEYTNYNGREHYLYVTYLFH